ncbi:cysteine sulfinate desulfinase cysteine desulfurase [Holzapfeliella floricola DSM 23037 = JCM 16512]|uniref:Cysteine sulfinate desulfinase cysteine desulfurase n=1 Tax=Holzapfeliella floricola DSM 23037 = JCM 16512 TaxID=1423744 RepID=A0A0R2DHK3_9LACO|nr:cysteine sulfinate desulfinase cysteine desulfurase [Holzapfeliella floricola DSM 23037 = JCM 16512]
MDNNLIYFDNSSTTLINANVLNTYQAVSQKYWSNPSSLHKFGEKSFMLVEQSRLQIADLLGVKGSEVFFTSSGTESDNWAIKGTAISKRKLGNHLITTQIEHPAVLNSMKQLEELGFKVTYLPVDQTGIVSPDSVEQAITENTILVSIMAVNNEIGSIQPIAKIGDILKEYPSIHYHVDAVQAIGKNLWSKLFHPRIDLMSFSAHKFNGPRGVGFLYKKANRQLQPLLSGGGQEQNLRSGTENTPGIVASAKALRLTIETQQKTAQQTVAIKRELLDYLTDKPGISIFSPDASDFAPHILTFALEGVRGETLVHLLEEQEIYVSTTSACSSKDETGSGTLKAMAVDDRIAQGAIRLSFSSENTLAEAQEFISKFEEIYKRFENISY